MEGFTVAPRGQGATPTTLSRHVFMDDDVELQVTRGDGEPVSRTTPLATGDLVEFIRDDEVVFGAIIVIQGDIMGNGVMSLTQLTRMASAYQGTLRPPLEGAFLLAADFDGNGQLTLTDLVREAALYRETLQG